MSATGASSDVRSAPAVIAVENVTIAYGDNVIQKDVSFEVRRGRGLRHPRRLGHAGRARS